MKMIEEFKIPGIPNVYIKHGKNNLASKAMYSKWFNGCCIGQSATLEAARSSLFDYVTQKLVLRIKEAEEVLRVLTDSRVLLADHPRHMKRYRLRPLDSRNKT